MCSAQRQLSPTAISALLLPVLLLCFAAGLLGPRPCLGAEPAAAAPMEYRYWDWGRTPKRDDYQIKVLELALEKTRARDGPYVIKRVVDSLSTFRVRSEVADGARVNVHAGPWRALDKDNPLDRSIAIDIPIMGALLGYRNLIVRRADLARFKAITRPEQLKRLTAGQGRGWVEVQMYKRNGYRVDDSGNLRSLLPMLVNGRIDYLPMSIVEIDSALALVPEYASELAVAPGIMLQYPLPVLFYVSPKYPALAERLRRGLLVASKDGSLDELLLRFFSEEIRAAGARGIRLFKVAEPQVPAYLIKPLPAAGAAAKLRPAAAARRDP